MEKGALGKITAATHGFARGFISVAVIPIGLSLGLMCSGCKESPTAEGLAMAEFNAILGSEKVAGLDSLVLHFQEYLSAEFPEHKTLESRTEAYLRRLYNQMERQDAIAPIPEQTAERILSALENSGLRRELVLCDGEQYHPDPSIQSFFEQLEQSLSQSLEPSGVLDMIVLEEEMGEDSLVSDISDWELAPQRNNFHLVRNGLYQYALTKAFWNVPICHDYLEAMVLAGDIAPSLVIGGILEANKNEKLIHPIWQRIIATEIFLGQIDWDNQCSGTLIRWQDARVTSKSGVLSVQIGETVEKIGQIHLMHTKPITPPLLEIKENGFTVKFSKEDVLNTLNASLTGQDSIIFTALKRVSRHISSESVHHLSTVWGDSTLDDYSFERALSLSPDRLSAKILREVSCDIISERRFEIWESSVQVQRFYFCPVNSDIRGDSKGVVSESDRLIWFCPPFIYSGLSF